MISFSLNHVVNADISDLPVNIHLTWQQSNMSYGVTVTWQTTYSNSGSIVLYDTISQNGFSVLYRYSASGTVHTYVGASGYIHDVQLLGLGQNSTYYFVCGGDGGFSEERSFRTAPMESSNLRFVVGGDSRTYWMVRDEISRVMSTFDPNFAMLSGDLVASGADQTQWDSFFESMHQRWIGTNNLTIPIIPCLGNHEDNAINYYEQFALPGNEQWFSLNWGEQVHITVLNSETDPLGEQLAWLENDLASHQNYTWKFVMFHRPPFSAGNHGSWIQGREAWCPLFDKYHVDIVFSGHDHNYERSKPINYSASKISPQKSYSLGTMYVVTGGWGAPLYEAGSDWWTDNSLSKYHFIVIDIFTNGTLRLQAKDITGITFDEVPQKTPVIPESFNLPILSLIFTVALLVIVVSRVLVRTPRKGIFVR
jgi:hypothetical protein